MRAHGTIPLITPWRIPLTILPFAWRILPCSRVPLTYLESLLCVWCDPCPLWSQVACKVTSPPLSLPIPFSRPQRFPISSMCPSTTTSQHRLHIVWYTFDLWFFIEPFKPCPPQGTDLILHRFAFDYDLFRISKSNIEQTDPAIFLVNDSTLICCL
jgi:hypothetical protein